MAFEKLCFAVLNFIYTKSVIFTVRGGDGSEVTKRSNPNSAREPDIFEHFVTSYSIDNITTAIRWLQMRDYLAKTYPAGVLGLYYYSLTDKGIEAVKIGEFEQREKKLFTAMVTDNNSAKERVSILITEGNLLLDKVRSEYFELRKIGQFNQDKHIPLWNSEYVGWYEKCLSVLSTIFPSEREIIKFKNAPISPLMQDGTNAKWGSLTNTIMSKLLMLDKIIESIDTYKDGMETKVSILFLTADPTDATRLRLGEEFREIQEKLKLATQRDRFRLELPQLSIRPSDISQALLDFSPQIVHFSGHGTEMGEVCFENKLGETHLVQPEALAALFEQFSDQINCVLLNACYSESQAKAIAKHIDYVIGMNQEIGDEAAIAFSIGFYQALGAGRSVEEAFKLGRVQISLHGNSEHLTPILIKHGQS